MKQSRLYRAYREAFREECKLPRKIKKIILGEKLSKRELKRKLNTFEIIKLPKTIYEAIEANQDLFCPKCGCELSMSTGNMVEYPELYEKRYCLRCGHLVEMADNSPFHHCLEFPEDGYSLNNCF
jgi:ribosomal protein S27AE